MIIKKILCFIPTVSAFVTPTSSFIKRPTPQLFLADESNKEIVVSGPDTAVNQANGSGDSAIRMQLPRFNDAQLLDDALRFNATAASDILNQIAQLRTEGDQDGIESFVNDLLDNIDGVKLPFWSRLRPLTRFSKRARKASFKRVLDLSTPTDDEKESIGDDKDADKRRRRRSLVVLLRALAQLDDDDESEGDKPTIQASSKKGVAIVQLEKAAKREAKMSVLTEGMDERLPPGLETPNYELIVRRSSAGYEIRKYDTFSVCSVSMSKPRGEAAAKTDAKVSNPQLSGASSFGALAGYLFGKNEESTAMKMTTPVLSKGDGEDRQMSFVLPSNYWNEESVDQAPTPLSGSGVTIETKSGGERAVVMFGGFAAKKDVEERTQQLLQGLEMDEEFKADEKDTVTVAQYNDPFTPPWKRRNEVSIDVVKR